MNPKDINTNRNNPDSADERHRSHSKAERSSVEDLPDEKRRGSGERADADEVEDRSIEADVAPEGERDDLETAQGGQGMGQGRGANPGQRDAHHNHK